MTQPDKEGEQPEVKLKSHLVVIDADLNIEMWTTEKYNLYVKKALSVGACPAVRIITTFDRTDDYLAASGGDDKQDELWEEVHYAFQALSPQEVINHLNKEYIIQKRKP